MGLSPKFRQHQHQQQEQFGRCSTTHHYRPGRHDTPTKAWIFEETPGMEVHGQVGGTRGTRNKLEDQRTGRPTVQGATKNTPRPQGSPESKGHQDYRRCQAQSKQPLGQQQVWGRLPGRIVIVSIRNGT